MTFFSNLAVASRLSLWLFPLRRPSMSRRTGVLPDVASHGSVHSLSKITLAGPLKCRISGVETRLCSSAPVRPRLMTRGGSAGGADWAEDKGRAG